MRFETFAPWTILIAAVVLFVLGLILDRRDRRKRRQAQAMKWLQGYSTGSEEGYNFGRQDERAIHEQLAQQAADQVERNYADATEINDDTIDVNELVRLGATVASPESRAEGLELFVQWQFGAMLQASVAASVASPTDQGYRPVNVADVLRAGADIRARSFDAISEYSLAAAYATSETIWWCRGVLNL